MSNVSSMPERLDQGASSCIKIFGGTINAITQQKDRRLSTLLGLVVDEQHRFILWTTNLGVFASVNQSLDFRLRDVPDMARLFLVQLGSIISSLEELQQLRFQDIGATVDTIEPFRSWQMRELVLELPEENLDCLEEPLPSKPSKAKDLLEAVHESVEWLYRLSNMVRRASLVSQNRRAAKGEMTKQVEEQLSKRMDREIRDCLNSAEPIDKNDTTPDNDPLWVVLKERLIRTMIIRYSRILYRRDRVRDNQSYALKKIPPPFMEVVVDEPSQLNPPEVPALKFTEPPKQPPVFPDRSHATTVNTSLLRKQFQPPPSNALSSAPSRMDQVEDIYPNAPKLEDGQFFTCSFCCCILSANEGRGQAWMKHIERDLDHYICLFHPCPCPEELYSSRQDWLAHIYSQHRKQWVCTSVDHGQSMRFNEVEVFQGHMRQFHPDSFKEDELGIVVDACEVPADPMFERCPFNCVKGAREDTTEDHVEHHLRAIALRSLPDPDHDSVFGLLPSTNASTASNRETENEENKLRRDTIYDSEVGSLPAWQPWPSSTEDSEDDEVAQLERKIIEDEGMTVDRYKERIEAIEQDELDRESARDFVGFWKGRPTRTEDVKVVRIKEKIESEKRKAEERKAGASIYTRWINVFDDRFGSHRPMEVEVDEGSVANLITRGMADDYSFEIQSHGSEPFRGETVNGDVVCEQYVEMALIGKQGQSIVAEFHVLPANEPPNHPRITKPLVGRHLAQEPGGVLLSEDPKKPIWSTKLSKADPKMQEQSKKQAAQMQAYQANASRTRDSVRNNAVGRDQNQRNTGSSSGVGKEGGK